MGKEKSAKETIDVDDLIHRIDEIDEKFARIKQNEPMKILLSAVKEYLMDKGKRKNGY